MEENNSFKGCYSIELSATHTSFPIAKRVIIGLQAPQRFHHLSSLPHIVQVARSFRAERGRKALQQTEQDSPLLLAPEGTWFGLHKWTVVVTLDLQYELCMHALSPLTDPPLSLRSLKALVMRYHWYH